MKLVLWEDRQVTSAFLDVDDVLAIHEFMEEWLSTHQTSTCD